MNPLQTGTPASALTPQGYKNSTQSGNFQSGLKSSDLLESSSNSYTLQVSSDQNLSVSSGSPRQVLGVSQSVSSTTNTTFSSSEFSLFLPLTILLVSAVLTFYFFKKYRQYIEPLKSLENE